MRTICCLLIGSLLFSGCSQYYEKIATNADAVPRPVDAVGIGDFARLQRLDGTVVIGTVSQVEYDYLVVDGTVIPWSDIQSLETRPEIDDSGIWIPLVVSVVILLVVFTQALKDRNGLAP